ncbi:MAG: STT3 domain-containing protein [Candidatus Binatia bacterium]|nr:STT3 domain-containing protein [Candidatus Binatia bacterium]
MDLDRAKRVLWMAALVVLGFLLRTTNAADVFVDGSVVFPGNDPYYQAHRVFQALAAYPWVPLVDPLLDHPYGAAPIWPPLFPWLLAGLVKLVGVPASSPAAVETVLALSAPVTGALLCIPVYALARRILDGPGAWIAATLAVLIPAHLWYSRLGFVDHHAAVTLVQVFLFLGALVALREGRYAGLATALTFGMLLWNGFVLFALILDAYLLAVFALSSIENRARVGRAAAWSHGVAAVLILPVVVATVHATGAPWGSFALSYLHPSVLAAVAVVGVGVARAPERGFLWLAVLMGLGLAVGVASGALFEVGNWVFARDDFMSSIQEVVPIFLRSDGTINLSGATLWLTRFWFVVPVLLVLVARGAMEQGRLDAGKLLLVVWGTALFVLALRQRRFAEAFAPALAILAAFGLRWVQSRVREALASRGSPLFARTTAAVLVAVLAAFGLGPYYEPILRHPEALFAIVHDAAPASPREIPASQTNLGRLGEIAAETPGSDPRGVMNLWPLGHRVLYLTKLPIVASPFGSHIGGESFDEAAAFFLSTREDEAVERMRDRDVRYVVVDNDLGTIGAALLARGEQTSAYYTQTTLPEGTRWEYQPALYRTLYLRLALLAGVGLDETIPALQHFRLLVDAERDHVSGQPKIFERVEGARLRLEGLPRNEYELRYEFESDAGRRRTYVARVRTDARGYGEIALPYSSERPDLGQNARWHVDGAGGSREVYVPEAAVREGLPVDVDLR